MTNERSTEAPGVIRPDELYTLDELKRRLGVERATIQSLKDAGLTIHKIGRVGVVSGKDLIKHIERHEGRDS